MRNLLRSADSGKYSRHIGSRLGESSGNLERERERERIRRSSEEPKPLGTKALTC